MGKDEAEVAWKINMGKQGFPISEQHPKELYFEWFWKLKSDMLAPKENMPLSTGFSCAYNAGIQKQSHKATRVRVTLIDIELQLERITSGDIMQQHQFNGAALKRNISPDNLSRRRFRILLGKI